MPDDDIQAIGSRLEFQDAIRAAIEKAAETGAAEITMVDPDFADWPLNDRAVVDALARWANSRRRLVVFAQSFDELARRAPRFTQWRRPWSHIVQFRSDPELEAEQVPTLLQVSGVKAIRLVDQVRHRGTASSRPSDHVECREAIDALLQRSVEAFPSTTLGL